MQTIYLDVSNRGVIPVIYAKQGDVGRKFQVVLTDSGLPYIPVGGSAFSVWYSGASGEGNYTEVGDKSAFSVSGNKVTVEMISQMLSNDGEGILSLVLNDPNGNQISTWNIHYVCEYVPGAGSQEAKAYYTAFSQAVENLPYPDASLSVSGKAADAAATGKALAGKAPALESANYQGCYYRMVGGVQEWLNPPMVLGVEYRTTERCGGKVVYAKAISLGTLTSNDMSVSVGAGTIYTVRASGRMVLPSGSVRSLPCVDATYGAIGVQTNHQKVWVRGQNDITGGGAEVAVWYTKEAWA